MLTTARLVGAFCAAKLAQGLVLVLLALLTGCASLNEGLKDYFTPEAVKAERIVKAKAEADAKAKAEDDRKASEAQRAKEAEARRVAQAKADAQTKATEPAPATTPVKTESRRIPGTCRPIIDLACGNVTPRPNEAADLQKNAGDTKGAKFTPYYVNKQLLSLGEFISALESGKGDKVRVSAEQYHEQLATMGVPLKKGGKAELVEYLNSPRVEVVDCNSDLLKGVNMGRYDPKTNKFDFMWVRRACIDKSQLVMDCDTEEVKPKEEKKAEPTPPPKKEEFCSGSPDRIVTVMVWDPKLFTPALTSRFAQVQDAAKTAELHFQGDLFSRAMGGPLRSSGILKASGADGVVVKVYSMTPGQEVEKGQLGEPLGQLTIANGEGSISIPAAVGRSRILRFEFPDQGFLSPRKSRFSGKQDINVFPADDRNKPNEFWVDKFCTPKVHAAVVAK